MKIGVTGSTGFIGEHLCKQLKKEGHEVIKYNSKNLDIRNEIELPKLDVIYHLAANSLVYLAKKEPLEDFKINALGTLHILEAMRKSKIPKIIYASSLLVYKNTTILNETNKVGINFNSGPYGISKLVGEHYIKFYSKLFGLNYVIFRISNLYGPGMYKGPVYDLISGFINNNIKLHTNLNSEYDFIFVDDVVSALVKALEWDDKILNLCTGKSFSLNYAYEILRDIFKKEVPIKSDKKTTRIYGNNLKIRKLNWEPTYNLKNGLIETVKYFLNKK